ncbi:hypothetical protein M9Y10_013276 [Tritrichomonas musculus]|uniref:Protein kinase domain-containing protein n=1 Tax=Tritrichomonas musculus TaxID=1915356 RepID=A0ABR2I840_9EUKA
METINVQQPQFPLINLEMELNTQYQIQFFTSLQLNCFITKSSDEHFFEIIKQAKLEPLTTFHFTSIEPQSFLALCCQNMCVLIEIDDEGKFTQAIQESFIQKNLIPSTSNDDVKELQKYINLEALTIPSHKDQKNIRYDTQQIKSIFIPKFFQPSFSDDKQCWTLSKFLYLSFDPIISYSIRRFYYPTSAYEDQKFFSCLSPESPYRTFKNTEFTIIRHIGTGNTGSVSLGIHNETGYIVALKSMLSKSKQTAYEKAIHTHFRHPFILHGYGHYKAGSYTVLITDYMCNGDLGKYCKDQSLDPTSKTKAIAQILCGIDYLHSFGIMHRDLKPMNILISHDKDFIISDFDTAASYKNDKKKDQVGTYLFMPPELYVGDGASFQSDLYSFGIIIYELAMGENPFENLSAQDAIQRITEGKIQTLPTECGTIAKLYKRCTEDLKEKRASSFYLLAMLFNEILFFANSDEDYIFALYDKIKELQNNLTNKNDRVDVQFVIDNANNGELYGMFNLAVMYHNNWGGIPLDYPKALEWFEKVAELNFPAAIYDIGNMYYRKRGVPRLLEKAFEYYKRSADMNFIEGYNGLGNMYYHGEVPILDDQRDPNTGLLLHYQPPDYEKALQCYKYAADRGHSYARCNCGHIYYYGKLSGGKPDYQKAVEWYQKAVDVGNKDAENNLGEIFLNGLYGDGPDVHRAFRLFTKAAAQQQPQATYHVATMLRDGIGTDQSYPQAAKAYRKSIYQKNSNAMADLAELIIDGKVERKDYCDNKENQREKQKIGIDLFIGDEEEEKKNFDHQIMIGDAVTLLERAIADKTPNNRAMAILARLYRDGNGVEKDIEKAIKLFTDAVNAGNEEAKEELEQLKSD